MLLLLVVNVVQSLCHVALEISQFTLPPPSTSLSPFLICDHLTFTCSLDTCRLTFLLPLFPSFLSPPRRFSNQHVFTLLSLTSSFSGGSSRGRRGPCFVRRNRVAYPLQALPCFCCPQSEGLLGWVLRVQHFRPKRHHRPAPPRAQHASLQRLFGARPPAVARGWPRHRRAHYERPIRDHRRELLWF